MSEESREWEVTKMEMIESRVRLRKAREAAGKHPSDLAEFVCNSVSSYYDLEEHNGELYSTISLCELSGLCATLGIHVRDLFDHEKRSDRAITPEQLIGMVKQHLSQTGISISEFESRINFKIEQYLGDPSKVMDWNIDFLVWLCSELGLDWRSALP
jgi:transcriptional regulator with XRE-family HTH domain